MKTLPIFKGYTIDCRLKELRWFDNGKMLSMPFDYYGAEEVISEYIETLDTNSEAFTEIAEAVI